MTNTTITEGYYGTMTWRNFQGDKEREFWPQSVEDICVVAEIALALVFLACASGAGYYLYKLWNMGF